MANRLLTSVLNDRMKKELGKEKDSVKRSFKKAKLIQKMASAAGIEPTTVRQILNGTISNPPDQRLKGFARVLDTEFSTLDKTKKKTPLDRSDRMT